MPLPFLAHKTPKRFETITKSPGAWIEVGERNNSSKPTCKSSPESKTQKLQKFESDLMDLNIETDI
jgi:hypothetical protein